MIASTSAGVSSERLMSAAATAVLRASVFSRTPLPLVRLLQAERSKAGDDVGRTSSRTFRPPAWPTSVLNLGNLSCQHEDCELVVLLPLPRFSFASLLPSSAHSASVKPSSFCAGLGKVQGILLNGTPVFPCSSGMILMARKEMPTTVAVTP